MKYKDTLISGLSDAFPLFCGMLAAACVFPTAVGLKFSLTAMILFCLGEAILLAFWMDAKKYGLVFGTLFLSIMVMILVFLIFRIDALKSVAAKILNGSSLTNREEVLEAIGITQQQLAAAKDTPVETTLLMMLLAAANGLLMTGALTKGKTVMLALMIPLPMFLFSMLDPATPPKTWTVMLLTVYIGCVLLGNGLRKGESREKSLFSALIIPLLLMLALTIWATTKDHYPRIPNEKRDAFLQELTESLQELWDSVNERIQSMRTDKTPKVIDLNREEEHDTSDTQVFAADVSTAGIYYFRTYSYGRYSDNEWAQTAQYRGEWNSLEALSSRQKSGPNASVRIIEFRSDVMAIPYAWSRPEDEMPEIEEAGIRAGKDKTYTWLFKADYSTDADGTANEAENRYYTEYALNEYRMPDGEERDALLQILSDAGIGPSGDPIATAKKVAAFVRESGTYVLAPGRIPRNRDFVLYFLKESHEGYCVHFASATTALLQALGYPARYTEGYYVKVSAAETYTEKSVTKDNKHAWTEIYVPALGWVPIESTPQFGEDGGDTIPDSDEHPVQSTPKPTVLPTQAPATPAPTAHIVTPSPVPATPEPQPDDAGQQETNVTGTEEGETEAQGGKSIRLWWILIPLVPLLWVGTGTVLRRIRESRFRQKNVKRAIPEMSRYLSMLHRFGVPPDPDAPRWALEAAYSNHRMREEHKELLRRVKAAQQSVYANAPVKRFLLRWVLFLI